VTPEVNILFESASMTRPHQPVLLDAVLDYLSLQKGDVILDGTIGYAGHSEHFVKLIGSDGFLIGIDQDQTAIKFCQKQFSYSPNVALFNTNFENAKNCLKKLVILTLMHYL